MTETFSSSPSASSEPCLIWFDEPAADWNEALPVGNGRLGAMVFGGVEAEHLQLNDNTLYSGEPGDRDLPLDVAANLAQVRQWLRDGKYAETHRWVTRHWLGRAQNCYEPLGDLHLNFNAAGKIQSYSRELDIANAVARVTHARAGVTFTREVFASHPAQAMIIRLTASEMGALNFTAKLASPHPTAVTEAWTGRLGLYMTGQVPGLALRRDLKSVQRKGETWKYPELFDEHGNLKSAVLLETELSEMLFDGDGVLIKGGTPVLYGDKIGGRGTRFDVRLLAQSTDGECSVENGALAIRHASEAVLLLTSGSSFNGFERSPSREGKDEAAEAQSALERAARQPFGQLRAEHVADHRALFGRVSLDLGTATAQSALPTPERIRRYAQGGDEALAALYYQFGRYLLIAGSRAGGQPLNLQGLWNPYVVPPWAGAYTLNINLEMNYWPAEASNLSECHEPLLRLVGELAVDGRRVTVADRVAAILAGDPVTTAPSGPDLGVIARAVAGVCHVRVGDLRSSTRRAAVAEARHLAIHLARTHTPLSFRAIGAYFGGRDPATVRHADRAAAARLATDPALAAVVAALAQGWGRPPGRDAD